MELTPLPAFPTPFVGRQAELAQIDQLLSNPVCRLLTLLGIGGIGKTRLALEAARLYESVFADGAYFVPLQPLGSPSLVIPAMARVIGLEFYPGGEPKQQLLTHLRERSVLLVLDNFEQLLDGAEIISEILAHAPQVKVIVTSRERLNLVEEWVLNIAGLAFPEGDAAREVDNYDAVQLFVQCAQRVQVDFTLADAQKQAVTRICQLVEGTPLGIELAAAWVRALSCQEIATEIERSMDILTTPARNVPARHRNIRAALEHSWNLLPPTEQAVFKRLAVFRGGFTREAAGAVASASIWNLTALVDKSLVRLDTNGRYHLQELLRQYAEEQLEASGESALTRDAHSAYYADFLHQRWAALKSQQQRQALDEIDPEIENIRIAWQTMCQQRRIHDLDKAIRSLWLAYDLRCRFHEMVALFGQGVDALRPLAGRPEVDRMLGLLLALQGWSHVGLGLPAEGMRLAKEGLALLEAVGNAEDIFLALLSLQLTTDFLGHPLQFMRVSKKAIAVAKRSENGWGLARALYHLANFKVIYAEISELSEAKRRVVCEEAKQMGEECLRLAEACGDLWLRASVSGLLFGNLHRAMKETEESHRRYEESLALFEAIGQSWALGAVHGLLGGTFARKKDYRAARHHFATSLRIYRNNGQLHEQISSLVYQSELLIAQAEKERAAKLLTVVLRHPLSLNTARAFAERMLIQLEAELPPDRYRAAVGKGQAMTLEAAVKELLEDEDKTHPALFQPSRLDGLTEREIEILSLMSYGMTNREIAERLILSIGTVKWYSSQIFSKLDVQNRIEALARARELKLLP